MSEQTSQELKQSSSAAAQGAKIAAKGAKRIKAAAKGAKRVKAASKGGSLFKLILSTPVGRAGLIILLLLLFVSAVLTGGVPATSFNSFTHVNENQDAVDTVATQNSDMDNLNSATMAEAEGINILGEVLSQEKAKALEEVKKACNDLSVNIKNPTKTISTEATLQMLDANFVTLGSDTYAAHAEGTYSEEEYDAGILLSAYSVSVDNLWGESEDTNMGDGVQGAIDWAVMIASDDSFMYGKSPAANHYGCYFCGNQQTKQKHAKRLGITRSYEKTYCCNTFITAAYVHGANDPYLSCRGGKGINNGANLKKVCGTKQYKNFEYLGHIAESSLRPGDVLVSEKHVKMYIGGGKQVESTGGHSKHPWSANTIRVCKFSYGKNYEVIRYIGGGAGAASGTGITGALKWAKTTADDNSYYYSSGYGKCHTCSGGKKAYVCTTFVKAAFAHGAGDAEMLKWCKNGSYGLVRDLHTAMKRSRNWKSLGVIPQKNMQPGDVLVYGNRHVEIYYGGGKQVGAHNSGLSKADQISVRNNYTSGLTDVMRYTGSGGTAGFTNEYDKRHVSGSIKKSDCKVVARIKGEGQVSCPQSFAYLGDNEYVVAYSNTVQGDTRQYLKKFRGSTCIKKKAVSLGHANGLTYNEKTGKLYSVRGYGSRLCKTFKAKDLSSAGTVKLPYGTSGIAYDAQTGKYYLSSGANLRVVNSNFKSEQTFKKKGAWRYAQDIGGGNGVIYSCVCTSKSGKNKICLYDAKSNGYCGEFKVNWPGCEIEGCAIDETGHLLILMNHRHSNTDFIYKTKEVMAQAAGSTYGGNNESYADEKKVDGEGIAKSKANSSSTGKHNENASRLGAVKMEENWRIDIREKLTEHLQGNDYYKIRIDTDEDGNEIVYDGVIDTNENAEGAVDEYQDNIHEDLIDVPDTDSGIKLPSDMAEDAAGSYEEFKNSNAASEIAGKTEEKKKSETPNLKRVSYLKIRLEKADIYNFAKSAFNVKKKDITEHYGKDATEIEALDGMTRSSLALLHGIDDFDADKFKEGVSAKYKISDETIGTYKITAYCNCKQEEKCKKNRRKLFGKTSLSTSLKRAPYATAAASKDIPIGSILYIKKLDKIVVVEEHLSGSNENTIAIFTGKNHENYTAQVKAMNSALKNGKSKVFLVTGITQGEAKNLAGGGIATGSWIWPVKSHNITSKYGYRICPYHGSEFHAAYDIAAASGTPVHAADGGTVTKAGYNGGFGYSVTISHSNGLTSMYNHMLAGSLKVSPGDAVSKGDVIGSVGSTGSSTGPHLDFRVTVNGKNVDPLTRYPGANASNPSSIDRYYPAN